MDVMNKVKIEELGAQIGINNLPPLFEIFTSELAQYQNQIKASQADSVTLQLGEICHALKSSAASFGADALCHHAKEIDVLYKHRKDLSQGDYIERTLELLVKTHQVYTQFELN
ncbi:Hpt domain-containing protein [Vibrio sp. FNV 38]|nr:Hpt domain-containing protein [Vibrio sp. FNV 38]